MYLYKVRKGDDKRPKLRWMEDDKTFVFGAEVEFPDGHVEQLDHRYADDGAGNFKYVFTKPDTDEQVDISDYADYSFNEWLYWRKFNALHSWFVNHYDNPGEDDCEPHSVSVGDMFSLMDILEEVMSYKKYLEPIPDIDDNEDGFWKEIRDEKICEQLDNLLQPQSGFFFGSTDYDNWYFDNVERTLNALKEAEDDMKSGEIEKFIYRASW